MNENTNLLSPERQAEIREALALLAQLNARAESIPLPAKDEAAETAEWYANMAADLLTAYDAQREQFRQALQGLHKTFRPEGAPGPELALRGIFDEALFRTAASLGIPLKDPS